MNAAWQLDHVGHAVRNLDRGISFYTSELGLTLSSREVLPVFDVEVAFLVGEGDHGSGSARIELLQPRSVTSAVHRFIERRGEGLHHICFAVKSVADELARLQTMGVKLIDTQARKGAHGKDVAFLHPHAGLGALIEISSLPPSRG